MNISHRHLVLTLCAACGATPSTSNDSGLVAEDPDAGSVVDAGVHVGDAGVVAGNAISAPADTWTWVDFPESKCASGSATGIGINPHAGSTRLLIYFEGGGACFNAASCWGPMPQAANVAGFDASDFAAARQLGYPIFSRTSAGNPFKDMSFVFVPYCTGDMHAGRVEADLIVNGAVKPTYFWGSKDLELFLARLVPTFSNTDHVWAIGSSAGGFATVLDYDQVTRAFSGVRVDIIDDSGPSIVSKGQTDNAGLFKLWGVSPPVACPSCKSHADVLAANRKSQPGSKFALMSFADDPVISKDFGYTVAEYPAVLQKFEAEHLAGDANAATFIVTNKQQHVVQTDLASAPAYLPWLTLMVNDDPAWASKSYAHP